MTSKKYNPGKSLSHFEALEDWLKWRKEQEQKQWEEEALKEYEDSGLGHRDDNTQQGTST